MKTYKKAMTIAGSDCSGGAGIQADLKTFSATGTYGMSVITSIVAENTMGVDGIELVDPKFIQLQIDSCLDDMGTDAIKIGMVANKNIVNAIFEKISSLKNVPIVFDPVMVASSGDPLLDKDSVSSLMEKLFPLSTLITPNILEAAFLLKKEINSKKEMEDAARELSKNVKRAVLIKGGHSTVMTGQDVCFDKQNDTITWFEKEKLDIKEAHGTGCSLSSAITSFLAQGFSLEESINKGKDFLWNALQASMEYKLGMGNDPIHFFYKFWN